MRSLGIIYHSAHRHSAHFEAYVAKGARLSRAVAVREVPIAEIDAPRMLADFDGLIWGSPTYLGGVSGPFRSLMDSTGGIWRKQLQKDKLAAGFTLSKLPRVISWVR